MIESTRRTYSCGCCASGVQERLGPEWMVHVPLETAGSLQVLLDGLGAWATRGEGDTRYECCGATTVVEQSVREEPQGDAVVFLLDRFNRSGGESIKRTYASRGHFRWREMDFACYGRAHWSDGEHRALCVPCRRSVGAARKTSSVGSHMVLYERAAAAMCATLSQEVSPPSSELFATLNDPGAGPSGRVPPLEGPATLGALRRDVVQSDGKQVFPAGQCLSLDCDASDLDRSRGGAQREQCLRRCAR